MSNDPIRIGNASGFYGDRFAAVHEMLTGGELDVLTGDYLAELTMLILARDRAKDPARGYATTFLRQMERDLGTAVERGVKVVTNAGGLNPAGLAERLRELAATLGLDVRIAHVEGDDLGSDGPGARNAYLGAWGIAACLGAGADVVVTGRVTDASLTVGPAAAHFGWRRDDWDALAGAIVAGHVIECGAQATGGNYSFFREIPDLHHPGFPIAEVHADGSSVVTKHPGTGGAVSVGTVTAQLLYEVGDARYLGPDVVTRLDTVRLAADGPDRVRISGVRGEPPTTTLKVATATLGGFRNEVEFVLTGLDVEAKARLVQEQLAPALAAIDDVTWDLARTDHPDAATEEAASARLRCTVRGADPKAVGRAFSGAAIELALASIPGFHVTAPPSDASPYGVFAQDLLPATAVHHVAVLPDGVRVEVPPTPGTDQQEPLQDATVAPPPAGATRDLPLGTLAGARSGDKGGDANIGLWVRDPAAYPWLVDTLTVGKVKALLPELAPLTVRRQLLPDLLALNLVVEGVLGQGVAYGARFDPQAKALGEWLRSRVVPVPVELLPAEVAS